MAVDEKLADRVVAFMNELIEHDREAIQALVENRVPCNFELAAHPTVQVGCAYNCRVGLLGILNGLCGCYEWPRFGPICARFDDDGQLAQFQRLSIGATAVNS